jgi:hypothetical protein
MFAFDEDIAIACVYFDHKQDLKPVAILRSILQHVIQRREGGLSNETFELYKKHMRRGTQPALQEVSDILRLEIDDFSKVFIVLDALDECTATDNASARLLLAELQLLQPKLRLMVTGRPFAEKNMSLFNAYGTVPVRARSTDIEKFVHGHILTRENLRTYASGGNELEKLIIQTVVEKAKGM